MREEGREVRVDLLWCISPSEVRPSDTDCMMYMNTCQESTSSITSHLVSTCHNWSHPNPTHLGVQLTEEVHVVQAEDLQ